MAGDLFHGLPRLEEFFGSGGPFLGWQGFRWQARGVLCVLGFSSEDPGDGFPGLEHVGGSAVSCVSCQGFDQWHESLFGFPCRAAEDEPQCPFAVGERGFLVLGLDFVDPVVG